MNGAIGVLCILVGTLVIFMGILGVCMAVGSKRSEAKAQAAIERALR